MATGTCSANFATAIVTSNRAIEDEGDVEEAALRIIEAMGKARRGETASELQSVRSLEFKRAGAGAKGAATKCGETMKHSLSY